MSNNEAQRQKDILAKNLNRFMKLKGVTQADIVARFNLTASTVSDWCNAKKYPRVDKIQMLADYLQILKSDLTEEKPIKEDELKNNTIIFHRNGETTELKLTDEKMDMFVKMIEAFKDNDSNL